MTDVLGPKLLQLINADYQELTVDEWRRFLRAFDQLVQQSVISVDTLAAPGSPANGDAYYLPPGQTFTGAWSTQTGNVIARFNTNLTSGESNTALPDQWEYTPCNDGFLFLCTTPNKRWYEIINGSAQRFNPFPDLGVDGDYTSFLGARGYAAAFDGGYFIYKDGNVTDFLSIYYGMVRKPRSGLVIEGIGALGVYGDNGSFFELDALNDGFAGTGNIRINKSIAKKEGYDVSTAQIRVDDTLPSPQSNAKLMTYLGASSQDLVSIDADFDGKIIILSINEAGKDVTVKHGASIKLAGSADFLMDNLYKKIILIEQGGIYVELSRADVGA